MSLSRKDIIDALNHLEALRAIVDPKGIDNKGKLKTPKSVKGKYHANIYYAYEPLQELKALSKDVDRIELDKETTTGTVKDTLIQLLPYLLKVIDDAKKSEKLAKAKKTGLVTSLMSFVTTAQAMIEPPEEKQIPLSVIVTNEIGIPDVVSTPSPKKSLAGEFKEVASSPVINIDPQLAQYQQTNAQLLAELEDVKKQIDKITREKQAAAEQFQRDAAELTEQKQAAQQNLLNLQKNVALNEQQAAIIIADLRNNVKQVQLDAETRSAANVNAVLAKQTAAHTAEPALQNTSSRLANPGLGVVGFFAGSGITFTGVCCVIGFLLSTNPITLPLGIVLIAVGGFLALGGLSNLAYNIFKSLTQQKKSIPSISSSFSSSSSSTATFSKVMQLSPPTTFVTDKVARTRADTPYVGATVSQVSTQNSNEATHRRSGVSI